MTVLFQEILTYMNDITTETSFKAYFRISLYIFLNPFSIKDTPNLLFFINFLQKRWFTSWAFSKIGRKWFLFTATFNVSFLGPKELCLQKTLNSYFQD